MKFLKNKLINRTVLSSMIWDNEPPSDTLRRRLEQKVQNNTLKNWEKQKIILILKNYIKQIQSGK